MAISQDDLVGRWFKVTEDDCAKMYPADIEFVDGGIYLAPDGPATGSFWHGGDWELAEGEFKIQSANDAMIGYSIKTLDNTRMVFTDSSGCEVSYDRHKD